MEGSTKEKGVRPHGWGADGAEASWQASEGGGRWDFEVFLSFRGADTRNGFTGHLYEALVERSISTFIDNVKLEKGERVDELFRYIERSKMFVAIISHGYADSKWCLREITKIVEWGRLIIPVFFGVEPSDVENQKGPFRPAFERHESNDELKKEVSDWKNALRVVGKTSGFNLEDANRHEACLIKLILEKIMNEVIRKRPDVGKYPVGLHSRVKKVIKLLDEEVRMVGICGLGGIGKTTLAKAVYNKLCTTFEGYSFLADVREVSKRHEGIVTLQKQLLRDVFKTETQINNKDEGITMIKKRIRSISKKVLLVVDDIDDKAQLDALAITQSDGFGCKSRIIVTSRDENVFESEHCKIYRLRELDDVQSLKLFSLHAFRQSKPKSDWKRDLSEKVVSTAGGLPLCLEVFGSLFSNIESRKEWKSKLEQLERDQHKKVHERLKISYDSLDENAKRIFLDIACFFINRGKKEDLMFMWDSSKLFPIFAIPELQRKSLISINDEDGLFEMHDQIRDMGRTIVQQQERPVPSRIWEINETLREVLQKEHGTENIEGIILQGFYCEKLNTESFRKMAKLRTLVMNNVTLRGSYHHLPKSLKFLSSRWCPLKSLPISHLVNIVVLELRSSDIEKIVGHHFWRNLLPNYSHTCSQLKVLDLTGCRKLKSTPDFRLMPNAAKLIFKECTNLRRVHESIGDLQSLVCLNLAMCYGLKKIPHSICRLSSLQTLDLNYCSKLSTLPEFETCLENLSLLSLDMCSSLQELPEQTDKLKSSRELKLHTWEMKSIPKSVVLMTNLQTLKLSACASLTVLPKSIGSLKNLEALDISCCRHIRSIPKLPSSLVHLDAHKCSALETISDASHLDALRTLKLQECRNLVDVSGLEKLRRIKKLDLRKCTGLSDVLWDRMKDAKFDHYTDLYLPGRLTSSASQSSLTISFLVPNVPRVDQIYLDVFPWQSLSATQIKVERHDGSLLLEKIGDGKEWRWSSCLPELYRKGITEAVGDGDGYRMIHFTFQAGPNIRDCSITLLRRWW